MKETKKQILIRLNKNTDLIKKEERKNKIIKRKTINLLIFTNPKIINNNSYSNKIMHLFFKIIYILH